MVSLIELSLWLGLGILEGVGGFFALREYNKRKIYPVFLIACINLCGSAYGFFNFMGRHHDCSFLIILGLIQINLVGIFTFSFIREMFGSRRKMYGLIQYFQIIFYTLGIYFTVDSPPIMEPDQMILPLGERISAMLGMACLFGIILDYFLYSRKKIVKVAKKFFRHLSLVSLHFHFIIPVIKTGVKLRAGFGS